MEFRKELLYKNLHEKEKLIFKEFEEPIYNFLKDLDDKDYLNLEYGESEAENFVLFMGSLEKVVYLLNNLVDNQKVLNDQCGILPSDVPYIGAHIAQIMIEKLRLCFVFFVKTEKLGLGKSPFFGRIRDYFKEKYPENKFITFLSSQTRNATAHYTYFLKGDQICFCKNYLDKEPICMKYNAFEKKQKKLNIIVELFIATFWDDFKHVNDL